MDLSRPASPCISICVMNPSSGWCEGCYRTLDEIAGWSSYTAARQWQVIEHTRRRRDAACDESTTQREPGA